MKKPAFDPARMFATLAKHRVEFVIIGGMAGATHGVGWPTVDADIVIAQRDDNLHSLQSALEELEAEYNTPHSPPIVPDLRRLSRCPVLNCSVRSTADWTC